MYTDTEFYGCSEYAHIIHHDTVTVIVSEIGDRHS